MEGVWSYEPLQVTILDRCIYLLFTMIWLAQPASAALVLDLTSGGTATPCGSCGATGTTFGWTFTVTVPITVNGIGIFDTGADGLGGSFEAGLYTGAGVLLRSATISDLSTVVASAAVSGRWLFEAVTPVVLPVGDYAIGSVFSDTLPLAAVGAPFATISSVTVLGGATSPLLDGGLQPPIGPFGFPVFGPTLDATEIPEPATASLLAFAMAAVLAMRRLSRQ